MRLKPLGEREIIRLIVNRLPRSRRMALPFGEDVSAFNLGRGQMTVVTCDMLVGKTDMPPEMTLREAARKAIVMNVSDMACKGVKPIAGMISLGLPSSLRRADVLHLASGFRDASREYDVPIIGGDTNEADDLVIDCSLFGRAARGGLLKRSGARPGDILAVTGEFGYTAAAMIGMKNKIFTRGSMPRPLREAIYRPKAALKFGLALAASHAVTASMDSSDGLAWSVHQVANASRVGFELERIPISKTAQSFALTQKLDPIELAFFGGEEYNLVLTLKPSALKRAAKVCKGALIPIGRAISGSRGAVLRIKGRDHPIEARGWEHLRP